MLQHYLYCKMNSIKAKPYKSLGHTDFKEIEVPLKLWNMESRKLVNTLLSKTQNQELSEFDAFCQIIENVTSLSEEDVFKFADEEITAIALTIVEQFRKKK